MAEVKYAVIYGDDRNEEIEFFDTLEEANRFAESTWEHMSDYDQKHNHVETIDIHKKEMIKEIRKLTGLSQAKFAARYEIPKRTIENWETGKTEPPEYVYKLLLRVVVEDFPPDSVENRRNAESLKVNRYIYH